MYSISEDQYREVLDRLVEEIRRKDYFSGKITGSFKDGIDWELNIASVIYNDGWIIQDIAPIWWEFNTESINEQLDNDFSFSEIRALIKE